MFCCQQGRVAMVQLGYPVWVANYVVVHLQYYSNMYSDWRNISQMWPQNLAHDEVTLYTEGDFDML